MYDEFDDDLLGEDDFFDEADIEILGRRRSPGQMMRDIQAHSRNTRRRAMARARGGRGRGRRSAPPSRGRAIRMRAPQAARSLMASNVAPGVPRPGAAVLALGFGVFRITGAATTVQVNIRPQRPILVRRLLITQLDDTAVAPALGTNLVTQFNVGVNSQLVGTQGLPVGAFAPNATDIVLAGDVATPGVDISLTINRSVAPGGLSFVEFSAVLFGESLT